MRTYHGRDFAPHDSVVHEEILANDEADEFTRALAEQRMIARGVAPSEAAWLTGRELPPWERSGQ